MKLRPMTVGGNPLMAAAVLQLIARQRVDRTITSAPSVEFLMDRLGMTSSRAKKVLGVATKYNENHDEMGRFASGDDSKPDGSPLGSGMTTSDWHSKSGLTKTTTHSYQDWKEIKSAATSVSSDMESRFPGLDLRHVEVTSRIYADKEANATCIATGGRSVIAVAVLSDERVAALGHLESRLAKEGAPPFSVNAKDRIDGDRDAIMAGIFRHELGHALADSAPKALASADSRLKKVLEAKTEAERQAHVAKNVSQYAMTNMDELHAEVFAKYTHPEYKPGTMPKEFEDVAKALLPKAKSDVVLTYEQALEIATYIRKHGLFSLGSDAEDEALLKAAKPK